MAMAMGTTGTAPRHVVPKGQLSSPSPPGDARQLLLRAFGGLRHRSSLTWHVVGTRGRGLKSP
jgi:hypothetical protein